MIIALVCRKPTPVLDLLVQAFDGMMPVCNKHEDVIGQVWIVERGPRVIRLETVEPGALELWASRDQTVLITGYPDVDDDFATDNLLVVTDTPGAYPCSVLVGNSAQELSDLIEQAITS